MCLHLASLLCARLLAPPSASECSSCARWLLLVVRGCLCSILPPSVTGVSSQSLASRGSPVSSPAAETTRGVISCFVAFRGVVAHSASAVGSLLASTFKCELGAGEDNNIFLELIQTKVVSAASCTSSTLFSALRYLKKRKCTPNLRNEQIFVELDRTMEGFAADFGLYGNSTSGFASSRWDWSFLSNAHVNNSAPFTRLDPKDKSKTVGLEAESKAVAQDCGKGCNNCMPMQIEIQGLKEEMKRQSQKMDEMAVLLRQLVLKADADPSVDVKTVASTTKSRRRSTSKQKGMRKDTPIDVPDYSSDHLAFRHSRRKRKTSSTGTPKQIISGKNDKLTRTLFSDKDEAKDQKERTPQTNKIGPSRPATHIGERPYVDLAVQGFDPNQAEVGDKIPKNTVFTFYPRKEMRLAGTDLTVAAYIFGMGKDKRKILVSDLHCFGDREAFQTLVPGRRIVDDIIILVATMLTYNSGRLIWYLPPTFAQLACGRGHFHGGTAKWIRDKYMANIDEVLKIYVPIWHDDHWFLLVIDMLAKQLLYLDSTRSAKQRDSHVLQIKKVALFLEEIVLDESWYACKRHKRPTISEFKLVEPEVNQQEVGT
ncbi:uncharacterized protein [Arachis hypogaea]|nr:uncharacterized protein LOC112795858 [Arachis hypogaea]QHO37263.1 Ulp1 protease family, carboxy-terminal domain protein [Arachis hypogaea]QHO37264.1 Ulp1 protease family, carboxy-terminal domain protein [Arachis hypogaea]